MTNILNPYIAGAPVVETSMFFGREDIFGWIERSLTGKFVNHILVLHGQRRVGKTSVLKQIPRHLPKHYVQVFFDLQGRTNTTLDRFLWWMASEISRTIKKECNLDLPKIERSAFAEPDAFINDFLPSLREKLPEKVLLLTFDEFDTLDRSDIQDSLARPLIAYLRRLMEIEGLNFIFSIGSSGNKLENMQASYTDFFKSALYRKVSFLTKDDCVRLITKPVEGTITYEREAVEKISHFTSGHPYFTQLMCHELFSRCQKTGERTITGQDVENVLNDVIERGTVNLKFVWDEASDLEKWILAALAQEEGAGLKRVHQILKTQGLRTNEADLNSAILHLRDKDVLTADNLFVIQLLKLWLQTNRPMDRVREELVQTNPISDRYIEIGDEYRERGENQQAIQSYQQALQVQANNVRALSNIAAIQMSQDEHANAVETFKKILSVDDENIAARQGHSQAQMAIAKAALREDREDDAERAYKAILHFNPTNPEANKLLAALYVKQAEGYLRNDQEEQGLEKFNQAIALTPEDASIKQRYEKLVADKKATQIQEWLAKAERSLARQRWEEAASMVEEAINIDPDNPALRKKLLDIKDAPRQEKIKSYKQEAEQAIAKGNYPKAISAIQTAIQLAPEDATLRQWIDSIQSDQANAQLRMYQSQADQAEAAGNWEAALAAREAALKLDPQDEGLVRALQHTRDAKQKHYVNSLRLKIDQAKKEQNWEAALAAGEEYLQFSPDDQDVKIDLENFRIEQRKTRLVSLKTLALSASKAEKWEDAIQHWQAYLAEKPEDGVRVEKLIDQAMQKAALLKDYETAQAHIRKRQYNRAINLLQGIIAKDPTYKASSRLLVEAVEANKQKKPIWKTPWVYAGAGVLVIAVVVIILLPQIKTWMNPATDPTGVAEVSSTPTESASPTPAGRVLTVNNTNDNGVASLRYTLMNAQKYDTIIFNPIFFPPDNPSRIFLESELPRITQGNITLDASNAGVIIDGSNIEDDKIFGLIISSDYNKIMGLQIVNFRNNLTVYVEGGSYNQIGGDRNQGIGPVGQGNLISNNGVGIQLLSTGGGNIIIGNLIGTDLDGFTPMGNGGPGISIEKNERIYPVPNTIGPDNIIAYNGTGGDGPGIELMSGMLNALITKNSIFGNGGKGINYLENDGEVEPPAIIYHDLEEGVVSGQTCSGCEVEIFSSFQNEGDKFEGAVKADDFGNFLFNKGEPFSGYNLTAIAISSANKTSEFSNPPSYNSAMRAAMNLIKTEPPDYESSFDVWEFGEPGENVSIGNGKLILPSDGRNIGQVLSNQTSDKLAIQFDTQILNSSVDGTCSFGMSNHEKNKAFGVGFRADGFSSIEQYVHPDQYQHIAEGNYKFQEDQPNETLIIIVEDQISVFINNQLIYSVLDPQGAEEYKEQSVSAEGGVECQLDNYKIWNLEGLEFEPPLPPESFTEVSFYGPILSYINDVSPTFEDDFSTPKEEWGNIQFEDREEPLGDFVVDEKLIIDEIGSGVEFPGSNGMFDAENFVLTIDSELRGDQIGWGLRFREDEVNDSYYELEFGVGKWWLRHKQNNIVSLLNEGFLGTSPTSNNFIFIVDEDKLALYMNGSLVTTEEGLSTEGNSSSIFILWAEAPAEFDNFQYWHMDGVDTYDVDKAVMEEQMQIVNSFINENPPTFVDDFSTIKSEWGNLQKTEGTVPIRDYIDNEKLNLVMDYPNLYLFPVNGFLNAEQFIILFEYEIVQKSTQLDNEFFGFRFLYSEVNNSYYELRLISDGHWEILANKIENNQYSILGSGSVSTNDTQLILLSVFGDNILMMINNQPVALFEGIMSNDKSNNFLLTINDGSCEINFDNIQFWNLEGVEINPEDTESQTNQSDNNPDWVTNFVDPVNSFIENRPPDIEDNFDTPSSAWVLLYNIPSWNKSFEGGEMILIGEAKNTLITYFDYVAEVEIRRINGMLGTGQGIGWNNGAEISCKFSVWDESNVKVECNNDEFYSKGHNLYDDLFKFRLIVKGGHMAFYLNDVLLGHYENEQYRLYRSFPPILYVGTDPANPPTVINTAGIDNFKVWNLTDLELP